MLRQANRALCGWHVKHAVRESHAAHQTKWLRADSSGFAFSFYQHLFPSQRTEIRRVYDCLSSSLELEYFTVIIYSRNLFDFVYVLEWNNCIFQRNVNTSKQAFASRRQRRYRLNRDARKFSIPFREPNLCGSPTS